MAIFGTLEVVMAQVNKKQFEKAFSYLKNVSKSETLENKRLLSLADNAFEKIELDKDNFALEQVYISKEREACFFESHKQYIDVQYILEGEEIIEVSNKHNLKENFPYDESIDLIKYSDIKDASRIILKKGDIAIFYPEDAHMPCLKLNSNVKVIKTVVKVRV
jgi:YhcH/YjgK/YiaL family protein